MVCFQSAPRCFGYVLVEKLILVDLAFTLSALKQPTPPMTQQPQLEEAQAAKPWAPKPVVAPQSKVPQSQETLSDLTGSNVGQSSFMAQNKGMSLLVYRPGISGRKASVRALRTIHFVLIWHLSTFFTNIFNDDFRRPTEPSVTCHAFQHGHF